jgi:hypothetical protein
MDKFCYNESINIQISDFFFFIKFCEGKLFIMYHDIEEKYSHNRFTMFLELVDHFNDALICWKELTFQIKSMLPFL